MTRPSGQNIDNLVLAGITAFSIAIIYNSVDKSSAINSDPGATQITRDSGIVEVIKDDNYSGSLFLFGILSEPLRVHRRKGYNAKRDRGHDYWSPQYDYSNRMNAITAQQTPRKLGYMPRRE